MTRASEWTELHVKVASDVAGLVSAFLIEESGRGTVLEDLPPDGSGREMVRIIAYLDRTHGVDNYVDRLLARLRDALPAEYASSLDISSTTLDGEDWRESWKAYFRPLRAGRHIVIKPSWETFEAMPGDVVVEIDPGQAFGVGTHASTALMLECMEELMGSMDEPPATLIDIGTGTGILAITAAKLGAGAVVGVDIDPEAERAAMKNVVLNRVRQSVSITSRPLEETEGPFEMILANIDRDTLCLLAGDIRGISGPGSLLIVSGILDSQAHAVISCYERHGFVKIREKQHESEGEWVCLVFRLQ